MENNINGHYFVYKNAVGTWYQCTNPVFIAEHKCCKAFPKTSVPDVKTLLQEMNRTS